MDAGKSDVIRGIIQNANRPVVFKRFVKEWILAKWSLDDWSAALGTTALPFRYMRRGSPSETPCWERVCNMKLITFTQFLQSAKSDNWMYFDYKYVHEWLPPDNEVSKNISWGKFGFSKLGPNESTLWIGSRDAHTPTHQDTYGCNIVAQLHGTKRWILFPPDCKGLKPTRIPYEESSVYSQINFHHPKSLQPFNEISDVYSIDVEKGDALFVPKGWWHYVVHTSDVAITLNTWLPVPEDDYSRLSESLVRLFVSQMCKDLPSEETQNLLNPNEDDVSEIPFVVSMRQVETSAKRCLEQPNRKQTPSFDISSIISNKENCISYVPKITQDEFHRLLGKTTVKDSTENHENEVRKIYVENLVNSFCQPDIIKMVTDNFINSFQSQVTDSNNVPSN